MPKVQLICEECKSKYHRWPSQVEGSRFCKRSCLQAWMNREVRSRHKAPWLRKLNEDPTHQARAARSAARKRKREVQSKRGYRYKKKRGHPIHRRVAERVIGRPLKSDEIVHHIDENSWNNDPSNLLIGITRRQHQHIHAWLRRNGDRITVMSLLRRRGRIKGLKYKFKTKPYRHQVKALKKLIFRRGGALFMEMGTGKTKIAIDFIGAMKLKFQVKHVVVVCPKPVRAVWKMELRKHLPEKIRESVRIIVINFEQLPDLERKGNLYEGRVHVLARFLEAEKSILIVDESHKCKKPTAQRSKAVYKLSKSSDYRVIMTGTKLTKNVLDIYMQFKILDERIFGSNFRHFKARYCVFGGYMNHKLLRYINLHELKEKTKPWVFQAKKKDCLDLPSRTDIPVPIKLDGKAKELYREMAQDGLCVVNGYEVEAEIPPTKRLRCQQISSGFVKVEVDDDEYENVFFGDHKKRQLQGDLKEFREQEVDKVVICAEFIADIRQCAEVAKEHEYKLLLFHGGVNDQDREDRLCEFDEADYPCAFILQNATGSMGISLTAASNCIHFSHSDKYEVSEQLKGRLHRIGQHHPVTHRHYIAPGADQAIWLGQKTKQNVDDLLLRHPEILMQEGYKL